MKITIAFVALLALSGAAAAQQKMMTPSQVAIQISVAINNMAISIENLQDQIQDLTRELNKSQARVKELESKYEPEKKKDAAP